MTHAQAMQAISKNPLAGTRIAITRPAGTGATLVRRVYALGGSPVLLPGSSLRPPNDPDRARATLQGVLAGDVAIFTSPVAVRFARALTSLATPAATLAPGTGTLRALRRAGVVGARAPGREDSEGLLGLPVLRQVRGRRIGIIGAAGGRGVLQRELGKRGAAVTHAYVYRRLPARLDRRHVTALLHGQAESLYVLLSSAEALANILDGLPQDARAALLGGTAVVSSERIAIAADRAGFARVLRARSAHAASMLTAIGGDRGQPVTLLACRHER